MKIGYLRMGLPIEVNVMTGSTSALGTEIRMGLLHDWLKLGHDVTIYTTTRNFEPKKKYRMSLFDDEPVQHTPSWMEKLKVDDTTLNIDSDVLLKPFWLLAELRLLRKFPDRVISGFNFKPQCVEEKNRFYAKGYVLRIFMGGINFLFSKDTYYKYVKNAFDNKLQWDWKVCDNQFKDGKLLVTTCPSVIQHNIDVSDKNKDVSIVAPDFEDFDEIWERILFI